MMGSMRISMRLAKTGSMRSAIPKGRKNRRDRARPAAKPPSNSGAPTTWASQAKNNTSETMLVGIRPGIYLISSAFFINMHISLAVIGAIRKNSETNSNTWPTTVKKEEGTEKEEDYVMKPPHPEGWGILFLDVQGYIFIPNLKNGAFGFHSVKYLIFSKQFH